MRHVEESKMGKGKPFLKGKPVLFFCALVFSALAFAGINSSSKSTKNATNSFRKSYPLKPATLGQLLAYSPTQLEKCDSAHEPALQ